VKPYVFIYCEGNDSKVAVLTKEKTGIKVHRLISTSANKIREASSPLNSQPSMDEFNLDEISDDFSFDDAGSGFQSEEQEESSDVTLLASELNDIKLNSAEFIPVVTEPHINYHIFENPSQPDKKKLLETARKEILENKGLSITNDIMDCIELSENSVITAYLEGNTPCISNVYNLATINGRKYYKIPTVKSADISLAYYISKTNKFFPEDNSLIIYIGKEYSKLIFMEGQNLRHIGSTLDIGTKNLHTYDVYFSKILLEMENGGIPRLDNIIICGEDRSENLVLSFYGTFPEANVNELVFDTLDLSMLSDEQNEEISSYAIPISAAIDYFDDIEKIHSGIHILPKYIIEQQKFLQFGWHSYAVFPLLFAVTFYLTFLILSNFKDQNDIKREIELLKIQKQRNQELVDLINPIAERVSNFDNIQAILDSATSGAEFWSKNLDDISSFVERRRNFWMTNINVVQDSLQIQGYSLSRKVLTEFANKNKPGILRNMIYEPLRQKNAFKYLINILLPDRLKKTDNEN